MTREQQVPVSRPAAGKKSERAQPERCAAWSWGCDETHTAARGAAGRERCLRSGSNDEAVCSFPLLRVCLLGHGRSLTELQDPGGSYRQGGGARLTDRSAERHLPVWPSTRLAAHFPMPLTTGRRVTAPVSFCFHQPTWDLDATRG
ncbi:hypothetical protein NDU88_003819 [Pleurodeles waltl]|uniref:Uncharacterized protein n=1 Tax=Pleurodeles waltl TaxID=8319 RepID=A0AAV7WQ56_PLEWA|nr:hypothetical protein NDU88_003819 [Pleurodeles waltl]